MKLKQTFTPLDAVMFRISILILIKKLWQALDPSACVSNYKNEELVRISLSNFYR